MLAFFIELSKYFLIFDSSLRRFNIILTISHLSVWGKQMENACLTYIN